MHSWMPSWTDLAKDTMRTDTIVDDLAHILLSDRYVILLSDRTALLKTIREKLLTRQVHHDPSNPHHDPLKPAL